MLDYIQLSEKLNISKISVPEQLLGKTVSEVNLRRNFGVNIIAIENGRNLCDNVSPDYVFAPSDILFVSGSKEGLKRLSDIE